MSRLSIVEVLSAAFIPLYLLVRGGPSAVEAALIALLVGTVVVARLALRAWGGAPWK